MIYRSFHNNVGIFCGTPCPFSLCVLVIGHHEAGLSLCPGGITIDMQHLKEVAIDSASGVARFQVVHSNSSLHFDFAAIMLMSAGSMF